MSDSLIKYKINRHIKQLSIPKKHQRKAADQLYKKHQALTIRQKVIHEREITFALTIESARDMAVTDIVSINMYQDGGSLSIIFTTHKKQYELTFPIDGIEKTEEGVRTHYKEPRIYQPSVLDGKSVGIVWQGAKLIFDKLVFWKGVEDLEEKEIVIIAEIERAINDKFKERDERGN